MKKLIAMIGAVAMAFGLFAEGEPAGNYYSTSFEGNDGGVSGYTWDNTVDEWVTTQTDAFLLTNQLSAAELAALVYPEGAVRRTDLFKSKGTNEKYLKLETGTNALSHAIAANQVYFDQLVKFTGYEETPALADGTKIAVWLKAVEDDDPATEEVNEIETNLYVSVGNADGTRTDVKIDGEFTPDTWYRLTIKSIGDVISAAQATQLGFQIFINGASAAIVEADRKYNDGSDSFTEKAAALYDKGQLFTAIDKTATLAKVAYQGIGGVDDIIFSQEAPDFDSFVDVTFADVAGVSIFKVLDSKGNVFTDFTSAIHAAAGQLTVTLKPADGYIFYKNGARATELTWTGAAAPVVTVVLGEDEETVKAVAQIGDVLFKDLAETFAAIQELEKTEDEIEVSILDDCEKEFEEEEVTVGFAAESTIVIAKGGIWAVEGDATFIGNIGEAGLAKAVTVEGKLAYAGTISAGSSIVATTIDTTLEEQTIVLEADASITTTTDISTIVSAAEELPAGYKLKPTTLKEGYTKWAVVKDGGFQIIISGVPSETFETLQEAVTAAPAGATIKVLKDGQISARVDIAKALTLDLNGNTITYVADELYNSGAFGVKFGGDLTITDSSEDKDGVIDATMCYAAVSMTIKGEVYGGTPAKLTVEAGTLKGYYYAITGSGNAGRDHTEIVINDGTIMGLAVNDSAGIYAPQAGTIVVNGGTITGATGIYAKSGSLTVNGGTIAAVGASATPTYNGNGFESTGDAIILDGAGEKYAGDMTLVLDDDAVLTSANSYGVREVVTKGDTQTLSITDRGATITAVLGGLSVSDKFVAKVAAGGATVTGYVASVNGLCYKTLADAVAAAAANDTVTLIADITSARIDLDASKNVTLDMNGKKITLSTTDTEREQLIVWGGLNDTLQTGKLTITGDGEMDACNAEAGIAVWARFGDIDIQNGTYKVNGRGECVFARNWSKVTIEDGTFTNPATGDQCGDVLNAQNDEDVKTIQVTGGFYSKDPAEGDDKLGPTFVADGYASVRQTSGLWQVGEAIIATFKVGDEIVKAETNIVAFLPTAPAEPSIEGKTFKGWLPEVAEIDKSTEFVAQFEAILLTATFFDEDGQTVLYKNTGVAYNTTPEYKGATPTKEGYTFADWTPALAPITADATYTATYTPNKYQVTFDVAGGSVTVDPIEYTYGQEEAIKAPAYAGTKEGFEFAGCWTNTAAAGPAYAVGADLPVNIVDGYKLTAVWNEKAEEPVKPGDVKTAKTIEEAQAMQIQAADAAAEAAGQLAVLKKTITENPAGGYTVKVDIKTDAPEYKAPEVAVTELATDLSDIAAGESITLNLSDATKFTPGLYYSVDTALELGATADFVEGARVLAGPEGATLTVTKPQGATTKAFFKVSEHMTATPPNMTE